MDIGVFSTFMSPLASPQMIGDFATRAEGIGIESLWLGEHVVLFDEMEFPYPGSADGRIPVPPGGGFLDTVGVFGYLAAVTSTLRFGTGITLVPQRNPVYTAKEFATIDWLSNGRVDFGVGVGWCKEEVEACGYDFATRGERCDEFLEVIRRMWTQDVASFDGKHFTLPPCRTDPKPVQSPHIPIIVGGHSPRAMRRAAQFGSGWYGFALNPELTAKMLAELDRALADVGRSRSDFEVVVTPLRDDADTLKAFADLGVDRLVLQLGSQREAKIDARLPQLEAAVRAVA